MKPCKHDKRYQKQKEKHDIAYATNKDSAKYYGNKLFYNFHEPEEKDIKKLKG